MRPSYNWPDRQRVLCDDPRLIAAAGLLLPATLVARARAAAAAQPRRARSRANVADTGLTVIMSARAGGDCIDDVAALRAGATAAVLGQRVAAPSTVGTFLPSFGWGHARQRDAVGRGPAATRR